MKLYSIHDSKAECYGQPMCFKTPAEAIRNFSSWCDEKESNLHKFPADYTLVELGEFNELNADITTLQTPRILANASEFVLSKIPSIIPSNVTEVNQ